MLSNWLKIYWSNTVKNKVYFVLTVLGLAIGIWGILVTYLYYQEEKRFDQWNPYKENIYAVAADVGDDEIWMVAPFTYGERLKEEKKVIEDYTYLGYYSSGMMEVDGRREQFDKGLHVQSNFFSFFPFEVVDGYTVLDEPNSIMLLDTFAQELFKGVSAIDKMIKIGEETYTVKGVYSFSDERSSIAPKLLFSGYDQEVLKEQDNWANYNATLYLKLEQGQLVESVSQAMEELVYDNLYTRLAKEKGQTVEEYLAEDGDGMEVFSLHKLSEQHMIHNPMYSAGLEPSINMQRFYILIGLSVAIFLLSVVNYINLTTVQHLKRMREMGIRFVFGSGFKQVFLQLLFETILTLMIAVCVSLVLIEFSLPSLRVFLESQLSLKVWSIFVFSIVFLVTVGLFSTLISTAMLRRISILDLIKGKVTVNKQEVSLKYVLLVFQFVVASFFITGAYVVYQQVNFMVSKDLGYSKEQILVLPFTTKKMGKERLALYAHYKAMITKVNGVVEVGGSSLSLGGGGFNSSSMAYQGSTVQVTNVSSDENFLSMMGIKLIEGRNFQKELASDTISNVLINEQLKYKLGDAGILGKQLSWNDQLFTVVGVVENYHTSGFTNDYRPMIFFNFNTIPWLSGNIRELYVKIDPGSAESVLKEAEKIYKDLGISDLPFDYVFLDQRFANFYQSTIQERNIILVLSGIVIFIALFGLYSLASFTMNSKLKEVAIRKVLGASNQALIKQLSMHYVLIGVVGFVLALFPSYYFMQAWLNDYVFRISLEVMTFLYPFLILMSLTLVTLFFRAYRATQVDVLKYIKYE